MPSILRFGFETSFNHPKYDISLSTASREKCPDFIGISIESEATRAFVEIPFRVGGQSIITVSYTHLTLPTTPYV